MFKRLVLIEDSQLQATRLQQELMHYGFQVELAHTGAQGLARIQAEQPDAVLLDVMLPDTDGYTLCQQLKTDQDLANIPILLLTSRSASEATTEGLSVGADAYIAKDLDAVRNVVDVLYQFGISPLAS
ncbi:MAG: response regulator transcription factor [Roseiflexaceae bacterium]